jgi:hypothetical protein
MSDGRATGRSAGSSWAEGEERGSGSLSRPRGFEAAGFSTALEGLSSGLDGLSGLADFSSGLAGLSGLADFSSGLDDFSSGLADLSGLADFSSGLAGFSALGLSSLDLDEVGLSSDVGRAGFSSDSVRGSVEGTGSVPGSAVIEGRAGAPAEEAASGAASSAEPVPVTTSSGSGGFGFLLPRSLFGVSFHCSAAR